MHAIDPCYIKTNVFFSESCEMWLHGKCVGISKRTMTHVYICPFCANTATQGNRSREELHVNALGIASPMRNKSFQSFR